MTITFEPVFIKHFSSIYLQTARALIGPSFELKERLLIGVSRGLIDSIRPLPLQMPEGSSYEGRRLITLDEELVLLPSLIDAHVHLALNGTSIGQARLLWEKEEPFNRRLKQDLQKMVRLGIGLVRDGGDCRALNLKARSLASTCDFPAPQIIASGQALRRMDGYGAFLGPGFSSQDQLIEQLNEQQRLGVDYIKVVVSGVVSFSDYGFVSGPMIKADDLALLVRLAKTKGLKVMAHASSTQAVRLAVQAGVDSLEHGYFVDDDTLKAMADQQIAWIPTVIPVAGQVREPLLTDKTAEEVEVITRTCAVQLEKVSLAMQLGVPLGIGTDSGASGVPHGTAMHDEIALYREAGLTAAEILKAALSTNARILGCQTQVGSIAAGFKPYLIAVHGNPLVDLNCLKNTVYHFMPVATTCPRVAEREKIGGLSHLQRNYRCQRHE